MTLDQLKILLAVADEGSVLAASTKLHRTQPTISVQLRKLEDELEVPLLDRSGYRNTLTAAGWQLYRQAQQVVRQAQQFQSLAHYLAIGHEPSLSLAIESTCPMPLIVRLLQNSEKAYPLTEFNLHIENISGAVAKLYNKEVDLAISPWLWDWPDLESLTFARTVLIAVAAPGFLPDPPCSDVEQMKNYVQVVVRDSSRDEREESFGVIKDGRQWLVSDHQIKKQLIMAGLGWGKLQEDLIREELAAGKLVALAITNYQCRVELEIRAVRRPGEAHGPVALSLWEELGRLATD